MAAAVCALPVDSPSHWCAIVSCSSFLLGAIFTALMATILPGRNSVESVSEWHKLFEFAGFIALGLLLLFEVLAYVYGNRSVRLLAAEQNAARERFFNSKKIEKFDRSLRCLAARPRSIYSPPVFRFQWADSFLTHFPRSSPNRSLRVEWEFPGAANRALR